MFRPEVDDLSFDVQRQGYGFWGYNPMNIGAYPGFGGFHHGHGGFYPGYGFHHGHSGFYPGYGFHHGHGGFYPGYDGFHHGYMSGWR